MKNKGAFYVGAAALAALFLTACGGGGSSSAPAPSPGIVVSKSTLSISEDGTVETFAVKLKKKPNSDVEITFTSRDVTEGKIGSDHDTDWDYDYYDETVDLYFTPQDWDVPKLIKVQGQADSLLDGNQTYSIAVTWVWSMDLGYINVAKPTVSVTNVDTSTAGVTVSTSSLATAEGGLYKYFTVKLNVAPTGTVTVPLVISDASEGSFSNSSSVTEKTLTFDQSNWSYGQYVYVYPVDDSVADGNQIYTIATGPVTSADANYNGLNGDAVSVTNGDNDTAGFTVSKSTVSTNEWGQVADFTVVLNTEPTSDVVIPVTSLDATEGLVSSESAVPASSIDLVFTPTNWQTPQTVTVTGQDDAAQDGDIAYNVTVGAPTGTSEYTALAAKTVAVVNIDDDTARVNIQGSDLHITEASGSATFVVSLAKQPTGDVMVNVTSNDTTEGRVKGGSSPSTPVDAITLKFTSLDWQTAQTVTVVGQDDFEIDDNQTFTIGVAVDTGLTLDSDYDLVAPQNVSVTNADNDVAGMTLSSSSVYAYEAGTNGTFTVKLNTKPTADVTMPVKVADASQILVASGGSGFVSTLNLTFTSANWSTPQQVTVQAINDYVDEGYSTDHIVTVGAASSADANYEGLASKNKTVYVYDNDAAGFAITPSSGLTTSEGGVSTSFTVALTSEPIANVFVTVSSGNTVEGLLTGGDSPTTQVDTVTLEFGSATWQSGQTVMVHGQDDGVLDGPIVYDLTVATLSGTDSRYNSVDAKKVPVTNSDNEVGVSETLSLTLAQLPYAGQVAPASTSTYTISGLAAGWKYQLTAGEVTDNISLTVKNGGTTLCSSSKAGTKTAEFCTFTTPSSGVVSVIISGTGTENGAAFTLSLSTPSFAYTFETYGGTTANYVYIYDSTALTSSYPYYLGYGSGYDGSASVTYDLVAGQTYYLKVLPYSSSSTPGAYRVQVTDGAASLASVGSAIGDTAGETGDNTAAGASALALKTPLDRYLSSGDVDWFKFTVAIP